MVAEPSDVEVLAGRQDPARWGSSGVRTPRPEQYRKRAAPVPVKLQDGAVAAEAGLYEGGGAGEDDYYHDDDGEEMEQDEHHYITPETVQRSCTDVLCCVVFALCMGIFAGSLVVVCRHGFVSADSLLGFPDYSGARCGGLNGSGKPYLYFCQDAGGNLLTEAGVCRESCPNTTIGSIACPTASPALYQDYPTVEVLNSLCVSTNYTVGHATLQAVPPSSLLVRAVFFSLDNRLTWIVFGVVVLFAILSSYAFLHFLRYYAAAFMLVMLQVLAIGFVLYGAWMSWVWWRDRSVLHLIIASVMLVGALTLQCLMWRQRSDIEMASYSINAACECFYDVCALAFQPIPVLLLQMWSLGLFVYCVLLLLAHWNWMLTLTKVELYSTWFCLGMSLWINEVFRMTSEFVISYISQVWFFRGRAKASKLGLFYVIAVALRYHLGSIAGGALVVLVLRPFRWATASVGGLAQQEGNLIGSIIGRVCCCVVLCFEQLEPFAKNAFAYVALESVPFCESAHRTNTTMLDKATTFHILNAGTQLFQLLAFAGNFVFGCLAFQLASLMFPESSVQLSTDNLQLFWSVLCGVVGIAASMQWMITFDSVSDTLLFCIAVHTSRLQGVGTCLPPTDLRERAAMQHTGAVKRACAVFPGPIQNFMVWLGVITPYSQHVPNTLLSLATRERIRGANAANAMPGLVAWSSPAPLRDMSANPATMKLIQSVDVYEAENAAWSSRGNAYARGRER
eukprot:TRINITY_DN16789_c0_g1_i1.p1 TRINITY_DN16789_c0_g1~~TRINITY_DN16789_c0_g1_i1.p1  ORF type:complete len:814 (-),score=149.27 TRINITY_DN16789_c0_g1_i1:81-2288(-)